MGILQSTTRCSLISKEQDDDQEEEGETPIHPDLQIHHTPFKRSPKIVIFTNSIYNALKGFLRKVGSIFTKQHRKAADPLLRLPVQNRASSSPIISTEPLLLQTPPISSPTTSTTTMTFSDHEESECDYDGDVDLAIWCEEHHSSNSIARNINHTDHHVVVSIPDLARSLACSSASGEMMYASFFVEEEDVEEEEEEEEVKSSCISVVLSDERWIKHYSSRHRILLVGEGDFSFSACLSRAFRCAPNIIATSLDSQAFLMENYRKASSNIEELRNRGSKVMHGVDATTMSNHEVLGQLRFDRIIYNFPYAKLCVVKKLPRESQLRLHNRLVTGFLDNARVMISEKGEIHITHKTNGFHGEWELVSVARRRGLRLIEAVKFNHRDYRGYNTKCGFGGDGYFNCNPSQTYKFGI